MSTALLVALVLFLTSPILVPFLIDIVFKVFKGARSHTDEWASIERDIQNLAEIQVPKPTPIKPSTKGPKIALNVKQRDNLNCPLCLDKVDIDVIMCTKCNTLLHYDCVDELNSGCCPVLGCETYLRSEKSRLQIVKNKRRV